MSREKNNNNRRLNLARHSNIVHQNEKNKLIDLMKVAIVEMEEKIEGRRVKEWFSTIWESDIGKNQFSSIYFTFYWNFTNTSWLLSWLFSMTIKGGKWFLILSNREKRAPFNVTCSVTTSLKAADKDLLTVPGFTDSF